MKTYATAKTGDCRKSGPITGPADSGWRVQTPAIRQVLHWTALQPKMTIGAPDDAYEREADRVADQVMRLSDAEVRATPAPPTLQRLCSECEEELRTKPEGGGSNPAAPVPPIVHDVLRSPGKPLDADTRAFFEPRFGIDFSQVRVHSNSEAAESTGAENALAYTVGRNIVFGRSQYGERTYQGRRLIAHELTHVVQQHNRVPSIMSFDWG